MLPPSVPNKRCFPQDSRHIAEIFFSLPSNDNDFVSTMEHSLISHKCSELSSHKDTRRPCNIYQIDYKILLKKKHFYILQNIINIIACVNMSKNNVKSKIIEVRFPGINKYLFLYRNVFNSLYVSFLLYIFLFNILFDRKF